MTNRFSIATIKSERQSGLGFGARLVDHVTGRRYKLTRVVTDGHGAAAVCGFDTMGQAQAAGRKKVGEIMRGEAA